MKKSKICGGLGLLVALVTSGPVSVAAAESATPSISGIVSTSSGVVAGAEIDLTYNADESCYALAEKKEPELTADEKARLASCRRKLDPVKTDAEGRFAFKSLKPGWYAIEIGWNLPYKPRGMIATFQGGFLIATWERNDPQAPFHIQAIGSAQELKPDEDRVVDFRLRL